MLYRRHRVSASSRLVALGALALATAATPLIAQAAAIPGQGTWETTLQPRDLDGNLATAEAYFDTAQNITWLADASGYGWDYAGVAAWVSALDPFGSGITGWRLPIAVDVGNDGCTFTNFWQGVDCGYNISVHSEISYLYYVTLGNLAAADTAGNLQPGGNLTNTGPFLNLPTVNTPIFWTSTPDPSQPAYLPSRFVFQMGNGHQGYGYEYETRMGWAVHSGDVGTAVSPVPVPGAVWMLASGLFSLIGLKRIRRS